jgi:hypothetical protein
MSVSTEMLAFVLVVVAYGAMLGVLFAFLWAVWNWIVLPSLPYVVGLFA